MKIFLFTMVILISAGSMAYADELNCKDPDSQAEMNLCAQRAAKTARKELVRTTRKIDLRFGEEIKAALSEGDYETARNLREEKRRVLKAHRKFRQFAKAQCSWESSEMLGGSAEPLIKYGCLSRMRTERTTLLKNHYTGL